MVLAFAFKDHPDLHLALLEIFKAYLSFYFISMSVCPQACTCATCVPTAR